MKRDPSMSCRSRLFDTLSSRRLKRLYYRLAYQSFTHIEFRIWKCAPNSAMTLYFRPNNRFITYVIAFTIASGLLEFQITGDRLGHT